MRNDYAISRKFSVKSSNDVAERIVDFLKYRHPVKTAEAVAAETGIAVSTTSKWLEGLTVPGGVSFLRLVGAYGPEFLCATMGAAPDWLTAAARAERQAALEAEHARIEAEMARLR